MDISAEDDGEKNAERKTHRGGAWLFGYDAPLHKLPCFVRVDDDARDAS